MSDEIKILIEIKGDGAMVGMKMPDTDPRFSQVTGDLAAVLGQVPTLVDKAKADWAVSKTYPKTVIPEPPPTPAQATTSAAPTKPKAPPLQPKFDL